MAVPSFVYKYIATGIAGIILAISVMGVVKWHANKHHNLGVAAEKAAQVERDKLLEPVAKDLEDEAEEAEDEHNDKTAEIKSEIHTGITEGYLERSRRDAEKAGRALGRAETIAELRANNNCLVTPFLAGDRLQIDGWDQQQRLYGDVTRGDGATETSEVRSSGRTISISPSEEENP